MVRAKFNFQQTNEDELSFSKGDVIHVTRVEEGGWWEGTHGGRTGWFPSNYVREVKPSGERPLAHPSFPALHSSRPYPIPTLSPPTPSPRPLVSA